MAEPGSFGERSGAPRELTARSEQPVVLIVIRGESASEATMPGAP